MIASTGSSSSAAVGGVGATGSSGSAGTTATASSTGTTASGSSTGTTASASSTGTTATAPSTDTGGSRLGGSVPPLTIGASTSSVSPTPRGRPLVTSSTTGASGSIRSAAGESTTGS